MLYSNILKTIIMSYFSLPGENFFPDVFDPVAGAVVTIWGRILVCNKNISNLENIYRLWLRLTSLRLHLWNIWT